MLIALVGRPNVGKSRLFNRLTGSQKAIVHDYAGVTRDRQYGSGEWYGKVFDVVDTGGFVISPDEPLLDQMRMQATLAMDQADLIVMVMDGREGLTPDDRAIVDMLRGSDKPVFFAVNKVDGAEQGPRMLADFWQLGVELSAISAEHGTGIDSLMDPLAEFLPRRPGEGDEDESPFARVAVVGKPNVGKSTLINALLGEERLLTSDIPGTTRDAVDAMVRAHGKEYLLIDTAGLRRKRSIYEQLEEFAVMQSIRSIDRCDVALLVLDATKPMSHQDKKIASVIVNRGKACVILFNKWDAVAEKGTNTAHELVEELREVEMPFMRFAPTLTLSAMTRQRLGRVLTLVDEVYAQHGRRVPTAELNRLVGELVERHSPPVHRNRRLKFYYVSQVATRPPTFAFICNYPDGVATSYRRFLENQIRAHYGFVGTPIRCVFRAKRRRDLSEEGWR